MNLKDLSSPDPKVKFGTAKRLVVLASLNPAKLMPRFDFFYEMLDRENQVLKWTAIDIVGRLVEAGRVRNLDRILRKLSGFLNAGKLITAGHAAQALAGIASARPKYRERISRELLKVERYRYDTAECRNVAIGIIVEAVGRYFPELKDKKSALAFVKRQTRNRRPATRKKAEQFLKKYLK